MMEFVQLPRGNAKVIHSGITGTTTSPIQEVNDHNAMVLFVNFTAGAGTWTVKVQGRFPGSDTYVDMYDINGVLQGISGATASQGKFIAGLPEQFKIVATEDADGATVSVGYQLISV